MYSRYGFFSLIIDLAHKAVWRHRKLPFLPKEETHHRTHPSPAIIYTIDDHRFPNGANWIMMASCLSHESSAYPSQKKPINLPRVTFVHTPIPQLSSLSSGDVGWYTKTCLPGRKKEKKDTFRKFITKVYGNYFFFPPTRFKGIAGFIDKGYGGCIFLFGHTREPVGFFLGLIWDTLG